MLEFRVVQTKMSLLFLTSHYCYDLWLYHRNSSDNKDLKYKKSNSNWWRMTRDWVWLFSNHYKCCIPTALYNLNLIFTPIGNAVILTKIHYIKQWMLPQSSFRILHAAWNLNWIVIAKKYLISQLRCPDILSNSRDTQNCPPYYMYVVYLFWWFLENSVEFCKTDHFLLFRKLSALLRWRLEFYFHTGFLYHFIISSKCNISDIQNKTCGTYTYYPT